MAVDEHSGISATRAWAMVLALSVLYFVSFVDKAIMALVVAPLKADLGVSDVELGVLFGPAFAIFFALLVLPFARIADRGNRRRLVTFGALLWGACTLGSGFVDSYWHLVVLRVGLAVGEATLTPAAYSLIGSMFPPQGRIRAASVYSSIGVAGVSGAYIVGALIIYAVESAGFGNDGGPGSFSIWQVVFIAAGAPAVLGAIVFWAISREPIRDGFDSHEATLGAVWRHIGSTGLMYPALFVGAGILQAISASYAGWGPELLRRHYGVSMQEAGLGFGLIGLAGAMLGAFLAPNAARILQARGNDNAIAFIAVAAALIGTAGGIVAPFSSTVDGFLVWYGVMSLGLFGASTGLVVAMQVIAPQEMRGTLVALLLLCMTLLAGILGPPVAALISTHLSSSGERLGDALAIVAALTGAAGVLALVLARAPLARHLRGQRVIPGDAVPLLAE